MTWIENAVCDILCLCLILFTAPDESEEMKTFCCMYCDYKTTTPKYLRNHINKRHGDKTVECPYCEEEYPRNNMTKHKAACPEKRE